MAAKFMVLLQARGITRDEGGEVRALDYTSAAQTFATEAAARKFARVVESGKMSKALVVRVCDEGDAIRGKHALASAIAEKGDTA